MQKMVALWLVVLVVCCVSSQCVAASVPNANEDAHLGNTAISVNGLPDDPAITKVAESAPADQPVSFDVPMVSEGTTADAYGPANPVPTQKRVRHHHYVRNFIIAFAAGAILYVALAEAAK